MISVLRNSNLYYYLSCDLIKFFSCTIEGDVNEFSDNERPREWPQLYVSMQIYVYGQPLMFATETGYCRGVNARLYGWDEVVQFPVLYSDLPRESTLVLTVFGITPTGEIRELGGSTAPFFSEKGILKQGRKRLLLWRGKKGDGRIPTSTPHKLGKEKSELQRVVKIINMKEIPRVDWLDKKKGKAVAKVNENSPPIELSLYLQFPNFPFPIVFHQEPVVPRVPLPFSGSILKVVDPEVGFSNPVEDKHMIVSRQRRRINIMDLDLKPNVKEKEYLQAIMKYPPTRHLDSVEMELLWKYRFWLSHKKEALTKFLKSIDWSKSWEETEALKLMGQWEPPDMADALEMLSCTFQDNSIVRAYAVKRLRTAPDEEIECYLLQLVQALRYDTTSASDVAAFLISRATRNEPPFKQVLKDFVVNLKAGGPSGKRLLRHLRSQDELVRKLGEFARKLAKSGWSRQTKKKEAKKMLTKGEFKSLREFPPLPLPLHPAYQVVGIKPDIHVFNSAMAPLLLTFITTTPVVAAGSGTCEGNEERRISGVRKKSRHDIGGDVEKHQSKREEKNIENSPCGSPRTEGRRVSNRRISKNDGTPLDESNEESGSEKYRTISGSTSVSHKLCYEYRLIFKSGDDLRQDQLVVQLISLMDELLLREHLDLVLTPYKVLATSPSEGMLQLVPDAKNVADVIAEYGSHPVQNFLREHNPDPNGPYGISASVLDRFLRSCAGYCVITYILGVGDRHLDNLLIANTGELFHIDFGFILGRDPKPFPPPMKITSEMVEGMGGQDSVHFYQFRSYCCTAYKILRNSSNLILNLISLMIHANIEHINQGEKSILRVQEKFKLELTDAEANEFFQQLIAESVKAMMAQVSEAIHRWKKYWQR